MAAGLPTSTTGRVDTVRYLTLAADYGASSPVRDDFDGPIEPSDLGLPDALVARLRAWNDRYQAVIPMDGEERAAPPNVAQIDELDREGLALCAAIAASLGEAKVQYYSEGRLRRLPPTAS
jgi:hypothetical protein